MRQFGINQLHQFTQKYMVQAQFMPQSVGNILQNLILLKDMKLKIVLEKAYAIL